MSMYVAIKLLDAGGRGYIQPGSKTRLEWLNPDQIERMIKRGAIRRVESPPLEELAGWKTRAKRLERLDIKTTGQFLDADPDWLAEELHVKRETVDTWSQQLETWMTAPPPKRGG